MVNEVQADYYDNTRVMAYFNCPRNYYFRHIRHWRREGTSTPLAFGLGIHSGQDVIWDRASTDLPNSTIVELATAAFNVDWENEGMYSDPLLTPDPKRNPANAMAIFQAYVDHYRPWLRQINILAIERPFIVTLMEDPLVYYIGRWDKVYEKQDKVYIADHKTTAIYRTQGGFDRKWIESFSPDSQIYGYLYAGVGVFGADLKGVVIDGILVHKIHRHFTHIPISRTYAALDAWRWSTEYWVREILDNQRALAMMNKDAQFMICFPMKTSHCTHKYGVCSYKDVCRFGDPNPEKMIDPPDGFIIEPWDPRDHNLGDGKEPVMVGQGNMLRGK